MNFYRDRFGDNFSYFPEYINYPQQPNILWTKDQRIKVDMSKVCVNKITWVIHLMPWQCYQNKTPANSCVCIFPMLPAVRCNQWESRETTESLTKYLIFLKACCACVRVQYVHVYTFIQAVTACAYKLLCECVHLCEFMCTHESCHGKTLPSPDNAIKALVLHVTFYLLSRETNKLPPYLSQ